MERLCEKIELRFTGFKGLSELGFVECWGLWEFLEAALNSFELKLFALHLFCLKSTVCIFL